MEVDGNIRQRSFMQFLKQGYIFRLKGDEPFQSDCYHIFIVLNRSPQTDSTLLLVNGTSQVERRKAALARLKHIDAEKTTVVLEAGSYRFISKTTMIDCNSVSMLDLSVIDFNTNKIKFITSGELSQQDIDSIVAATLNSPVVAHNIKQKIDPNYR